MFGGAHLRGGGPAKKKEANMIDASARLWATRARSFAKRNRFFFIKYGLWTGLGAGYWISTRPSQQASP
jgi:hypothetical protein